MDPSKWDDDDAAADDDDDDDAAADDDEPTYLQSNHTRIRGPTYLGMDDQAGGWVGRYPQTSLLFS